MFKVEKLVSRVLKGGKLVSVETFFVANEAGEPVTGKAHDVEQDAIKELGGMKFLASGMEFAKAQYPELSEKAMKGKANVIAEFLAWEEAGRPVKEVEPKEEPVAETETTEEVAEDEVEF